MSNSTKTFGKRKSFNKSSENISKAKMLSKSSISKIIDKSAKTPGTPGQTKFVPKISSEQKQNSNKANKKRKSLPANLINGSDDITPKKSKLEPFSGTSDLFMQMKESENESKDTDEKSDAKDTKSNRKQRKDNARTLRVAAKERFKKTIADAASGNDEAVTFVKSKIEELENKTQLTNSCKRKLKLLRRVLKNSGISLPNISKTEKQDSNVAKQNNLGQNNKNKNKNKKSELSKLQTKTKKDPAIDSEEESENDEDEEDDSSDNQVSKLIEKESTEEDEIDEEDTDDDEEEDDKDEEGEEEEDGESDEKEEDESGSDENEIPSTNTPAPKKKNQTQAEINSSPRSKSQLTLFVGNIPYDVTQEDIAEHFSKAGNVKDIRIPLDKKTNKSRGFAYVELANNPSYQKALTLNQTTLKGRRINVKDSESGNKKGKNMKSPAMKQGGKPFGNFKGPHKGFAGRQKRQSK